MKRTGVYLTDDQIAERVEQFRYVRDENNCPIGIVVLDKESRFGWSLYNKDHEDEMATADKGLLIALSRAITFKNIVDVKIDLQDRIAKMFEYRIGMRLREVFATILTMQEETIREKK